MKKQILVPALLLVAIVGCAKKKEYEKLHIENPEAHVSKSLIEGFTDINDPLIYVPSVENTPYNIDASRPFTLGEQKLVVAKIEKDEIKFLQIEEDERFNDNINNFSPVLSLPVEHKHYKCKEDDYGDCTNQEEEDSEIHWSQKRFVQINTDKIDVKEVNLLPIQLGELFQKGCFSAVGQEVKSFKVEKDAINFVVKKTYKAAGKPGCLKLEEASDLRYTVFTIDYGYSLVKLSSLADKNYETINYPKTDESMFGFFKTDIKKKSVDNLDSLMGLRSSMMNRWSPNKKEIIYNLNDEFYKPENKIVLDSTYEAIESVNTSLRKANAGIRIKLENGTGKSISDIRNNFIIYVKDPQASGVIGYGPSIANPLTGEIINARTVMYYGTIVKFVSSTYDELVDEAQEASKEKKVLKLEKSQAKKALDTLAHAGHNHGELDLGLNTDALAAIDVHELNRRDSDYFSNILDSVFEKPEDITSLQKEASDFEKKIAKMAEKTFYHASQINFDAAMVQALHEQLASGKKLEKWADLSESERSEVIKKLLPFIWVPTLVHEFGHNLGLRHNFAGSRDKDNFYTTNERRALGMNRKVTYSSIMDYAHSQTNELPIMGKYDVAALRFAYAREVESKSGGYVKVKKTIKDQFQGNTKSMLKKFDYCSDEHVGTDPTCNRFDQGSSYTEVVKHYVDSYNKTYDKRNFRGRRYSFEGRSGDFSYLLATFNKFATLRNFFEIYDQKHFHGDYDEKEEGEEQSEDEKAELKDIKDAADIAFNFFMDILETPSYHCAVKSKESGDILAVRPFTEFAKSAGINFDLKNGCSLFNNPKSPYAFYEFGKYFNNALDTKVDRSQVVAGDSSQMDVRGIWMDKAVATMFLSMRIKTPTTVGTKSAGNFLDYKEYKERFMNFADSLLNNQFIGEVTLEDGSKEVIPYEFDNSQNINASYNRVVNAVFGLSDSKTDFKKVFFTQLKSNLKEVANEGELDAEEPLFSLFDVDQVSIRRNLSEFNYNHIVEFKRSNGSIAYRFGLYDYNTKAIELMLLKNQLETIEGAKLKPEQVQALFASLRKGDVEADETLDEATKKVALKILIETIRVMVGSDDVELAKIPANVKKAVHNEVALAVMKILTGAATQTSILHSFLALSK